MDPFLGEIKLVPYNFAPRGWAFCDGTIMSIAQNTALFALLGTTYGGNGQSTFALPDLRSRAVVGFGQGPGTSNYALGEQLGVEAVTLTVAQIPPHTHGLHVSSAQGDTSSPSNNYLAKAPLAIGNLYGAGANAVMAPGTIALDGNSTPHNNLQPYLVLNYIIALQGIFPSRN